MMNETLVVQTLAICKAFGVKSIVVCPGARNSPFVQILAQTHCFEVCTFFEERSAAFFALGKAQSQKLPVVVVTTSGTAVAELLPAVIEAHYTGTPLWLVTADRPKRLRGTGAPQTIEQPGIFTHYVQQCDDIEAVHEFQLIQPPQQGSWHLNLCFDEPLFDTHFSYSDELLEQQQLSISPYKYVPDMTEEASNLVVTMVSDFFNSTDNPLVILGAMNLETAKSISRVLQNWGLTVFAEGPSQLQDSIEMAPRITSEHLVKQLIHQKYFTAVLRIGGIPTCRLWRDLDQELKHLPLLSLSELKYQGLDRGKICVGSLSRMAESLLAAEIRPRQDQKRRRENSQDEERYFDKLALFQKYPQSEPSLFWALRKSMPAEALVYLGNSSPIRLWDFVQDPTLNAYGPREQAIYASRGANGIDGQLSTFLGICREGVSNYCVLGDLTLLYDLAGPWALQFQKNQNIKIVVINNQGGKIFKKMFNHPAFYNEHNIQFSAWAEMWKLSYVRVDSPFVAKDYAHAQVIEVCPSTQQTEQFWQSFEQLAGFKWS